MKRIVLLVSVFVLISAAIVFAGAVQEESVTLKVGMEGTYPPFTYKNSSGELVGFEVDLANELSKRMGIDMEFICNEWDGLIPGLLAGKFDMLIATVSITPARQKKIDFSISYRASTGRFVARKGLGVNPYNEDGTPNPDALKGSKVGVTRATTHNNYLDKKFPGVEYSLYTQTSDMLLDLQAGRIDLVFHGPIKMSASFLELPAGKDFEYVGEEIEDTEIFGSGVGVAIRKGNEELLKKVNDALESIFADGTFEKINKKYWNFSVLPSVWK